jgi:hypothetical protein
LIYFYNLYGFIGLLHLQLDIYGGLALLTLTAEAIFTRNEIERLPDGKISKECIDEITAGYSCRNRCFSSGSDL